VASASTFSELADRIARSVGWLAIAFNFRGTGASEGDFSVNGWLEDLRAVVAATNGRPDVRDVWLVGVAEGGTLALCEAADDPTVRGVATLAAPLSFREWARDPVGLLDDVRRAGMVRRPDFPESVAAWGREFASIDACDAARRVAPRPVFVLHGSDDASVPLTDARAIAEAAGEDSQFCVVQAAGHELRHDPRAMAALLGWLDRVAP
jgi:putative redox protein